MFQDKNFFTHTPRKPPRGQLLKGYTEVRQFLSYACIWIYKVPTSICFAGELALSVDEPVEKTVDRINHHYVDSSRIIKRAFGDTLDDDFQKYNWGISMMPELGLEGDKLEFLTSLYCRTISKRLVESDFKVIVLYHTTFKNIDDRREKKERWLDLKISWRIQKYRKTGYPDSITQRSMRSIMKVNELSFDIDIVRATKDMRKYDKSASKLHMLLLDDPLLGDGGKKIGKNLKESPKQDEDNEKELNSFEEVMRREEEEYGIVKLAEIERCLKKKLDQEEALIQYRIHARRENEVQRIRKEQEGKEKALNRLEEIRKERVQNVTDTERRENAKRIITEDSESIGLENEVLSESIASNGIAISAAMDDEDIVNSVTNGPDTKTIFEKEFRAIKSCEIEKLDFSSENKIDAVEKLAVHINERDMLKRAEKTEWMNLVFSRLSVIVENGKVKKYTRKEKLMMPSSTYSEKYQIEMQTGSDKLNRMRKIQENRLFRQQIENRKMQQEEEERKSFIRATNLKTKFRNIRKVHVLH